MHHAAWANHTENRLQLRPRGTHGAQLGDEVVYAEEGDLVFKPRKQWHTFWNAGDGPCRVLEIISPEDSSMCSRK
jgi:mannose-6-phosphate isomerase-like protein (cupin superfamily)